MVECLAVVYSWYLRGPGFESRPGGRQSCQRVFIALLSLSKIQGEYLKVVMN